MGLLSGLSISHAVSVVSVGQPCAAHIREWLTQSSLLDPPFHILRTPSWGFCDTVTQCVPCLIPFQSESNGVGRFLYSIIAKEVEPRGFGSSYLPSIGVGGSPRAVSSPIDYRVTQLFQRWPCCVIATALGSIKNLEEYGGPCSRAGFLTGAPIHQQASLQRTRFVRQRV